MKDLIGHCKKGKQASYEEKQRLLFIPDCEENSEIQYNDSSHRDKI